MSRVVVIAWQRRGHVHFRLRLTISTPSFLYLAGAGRVLLLCPAAVAVIVIVIVAVEPRCIHSGRRWKLIPLIYFKVDFRI